LLPRVNMGRLGFSAVFGVGVGFDGLVGPGAAEVVGTPVFGFCVPLVEYFLFEGVVLPVGLVSYFRMGLDYYREASALRVVRK
jgi:hypothetical protein